MRTRSKLVKLSHKSKKTFESLLKQFKTIMPTKSFLLSPLRERYRPPPWLRKAAEVPPNLDLCKMWGEEVLQGRCEVVAPENSA